MTGSMIGIFVSNPANGWYHEFGTHDAAEILREYAVFTGPSERRRDAKFFDSLEAGWRDESHGDACDEPEFLSLKQSTPISEFQSKCDGYASNVNTSSETELGLVAGKSSKNAEEMDINTILSEGHSASKSETVRASVFPEEDRVEEQNFMPFSRPEVAADPLGPFLDDDEWENISSGLSSAPPLYGPFNGNAFGMMETSSPTSVQLKRRFDFTASCFSETNKGNNSEFGRFSSKVSTQENSVVSSKRPLPFVCEKPPKFRRTN